VRGGLSGPNEGYGIENRSASEDRRIEQKKSFREATLRNTWKEAEQSFSQAKSQSSRKNAKYAGLRKKVLGGNRVEKRGEKRDIVSKFPNGAHDPKTEGN